MRGWRILLAVGIALAIMPSGALAEDCVPITTRCMFGNSPICTDDRIGEDHYLVMDCLFPTLEGCGPTTSFWIYEETNGIDGLQRKDEFVGDQTCGLYPSDTILL